MNTEEEIHNVTTGEKDEADLKTSIEERPEVSEKNKYLYPTGCGKMEHGVVDSDSKEKHKEKKKVMFLAGDIR